MFQREIMTFWHPAYRRTPSCWLLVLVDCLTSTGRQPDERKRFITLTLTKRKGARIFRTFENFPTRHAFGSKFPASFQLSQFYLFHCTKQCSCIIITLLRLGYPDLPTIIRLSDSVILGADYVQNS